LDQIIVRGGQIGRVKQACTCSVVAVASDHAPTYLEIRVGRMQRRQKAVGQTKPANIAALRDPETRQVYANAVGLAMGSWRSAHPEASLGERAEAFELELELIQSLEILKWEGRRHMPRGWDGTTTMVARVHGPRRQTC
jgi:hypothetical protein